MPSILNNETITAFVGKNTAYYVKAWNSRHGIWRWNWAAALFGPLWMAYRRLYLWALLWALMFVWADFWAAASPSSISVVAEPFILSGLLGNSLYYLSFRRALRSSLPAMPRGPHWAAALILAGLMVIGSIGLPFFFHLPLYTRQPWQIQVRSLLWDWGHPETNLNEINSLQKQVRQAYWKGNFKASIGLAQGALGLVNLKFSQNQPLRTAWETTLIRLNREAGHYQAARTLATKLLHRYEITFGPDSLFTALFTVNLVDLDLAQGLVDQAKSGAYNSLIIWDHMPDNITQPVVVEQKASLYSDMGVTLQAYGRMDEARSYHEQALRLYQSVHGEQAPESWRYLVRLGDYDKEMLQWDQAGSYYVKAEQLIKRNLSGPNPVLPVIITALGDLDCLKRHYSRAARRLEQARQLGAMIYGPDHLVTAAACYGLGKVFFSQGHMQAAETKLKQALAAVEKSIGRNNIIYAGYNQTLADFYYFRNQRDRAEKLFRESLAIFTGIYGSDHPRLIFCLERLEALAEARDDVKKAVGYLKQTAGIRAHYGSKAIPSRRLVALDREGIKL